MDTEMLESTVDTADTAEVTTDADLSAFDEGWEDNYNPNGSSVEAEPETEDAPEADQPVEQESGAEQTEESATQPTEDKPEDSSTDSADQRMTVKHLDTVRELDWNKDKDEIKTLVQKGMDYDRKTQKLSDLEDFLKELAEPQKLTVDQLIDVTRARVLAAKEAKEGREISDNEALLTVQKQRADKAEAQRVTAEAQKLAAKESAENKNRDMLNRFISAYPDIKGEDIPKSVWEESSKSGDLVAAYAKYERKQLEDRIAVLEQNKKNSERSIGSVRSTGAAKQLDAFDEGWNID